MTDHSDAGLATVVNAQVKMLEDGKPLEAFDAFYSRAVLMYANDELFASGASQGRSKQEPFIAAAKSIAGRIVDVRLDAENNICVFRNQTQFTSLDGKRNQIDGVCWQRWADGLIVEERYYDGRLMRELISDGLLEKPVILSSRLKNSENHQEAL